MKSVSSIIISILFFTSVNAQNIHHTDVIALGMGNAYLSDGHDFNAFLYNPALLARLDKRLHVEFGNVEVSISSNFFSKKDFLEDNQEDFVNFQVNALSSEPELNTRSLNLQKEVQEDILDEPTELSFSPSLLIKWWHLGLALYTDWSYGFVMDFEGVIDPQNQRFEAPSARTRGEQDIAVIIGYGTSVKYVKGLSVGGSFKFFRRRLAQRRLAPVDFDNVINISRSALGESNYFTRFGLDFGVTYDIKKNLSVGLVLNDIIDSNNFADVEPMSLNVGMSYQVSNDLTFNVDIIDLLDKTDNDFVEKNIRFEETDRIRMGAQYSKVRFANLTLPLRIGLGGGFITAGFGVVSQSFYKFKVRLDYALANSSKIDELEHVAQLKLNFKL